MTDYLSAGASVQGRRGGAVLPGAVDRPRLAGLRLPSTKAGIEMPGYILIIIFKKNQRKHHITFGPSRSMWRVETSSRTSKRRASMLRGCGLGEKVDKIELAKHADMIADAYWRITAATREANSANWDRLGIVLEVVLGSSRGLSWDSERHFGIVVDLVGRSSGPSWSNLGAYIARHWGFPDTLPKQKTNLNTKHTNQLTPQKQTNTPLPIPLQQPHYSLTPLPPNAWKP